MNLSSSRPHVCYVVECLQPSTPGFVVAVNASDPGHDPTPIVYSISASESE